MSEEGKARSGALEAGLGLLGGLWLVFLPIGVQVGLFGGPFATTAGFVVVLLPLAGFVIAMANRRKAPALAFGIALLLAFGAIGYATARVHQHPPNRMSSSPQADAALVR